MKKQRKMHKEHGRIKKDLVIEQNTGNNKLKKGLQCQISTLGNKMNSVIHQEIGRGASSGDEVMSLVLDMLNLRSLNTTV